jgi:hypothetical protein
MDSQVSEPVQSNWTDGSITKSTLYASAQDTITLSSGLSNTVIGSPYTVSTTAMGTNFPNSIWTTGTTTAPWLGSNPTGVAPKITLNGEGADVEVNGWSLVAAVKRIEERLGLYQPNPELEAEWSDLRDLGEQYRKLEQHIKNKQATFDRLKAMPAPDID